MASRQRLRLLPRCGPRRRLCGCRSDPRRRRSHAPRRSANPSPSHRRPRSAWPSRNARSATSCPASRSRRAPPASAGRRCVAALNDAKMTGGHGAPPCCAMGAEGIEALGRRVMRVGQKDIRRPKDEIARALVTDAHLVRGPEPIEDRESDAQQWNAQPRRHLTAMCVRDDQVAPSAPISRSSRSPTRTSSAGMRDEHRRRIGRDRDQRSRAPMSAKNEASVKARSGSAADCDVLAAEMEMPVEHRVDELAAPPQMPGGDRSAGEIGEQGHQFIRRGQAVDAIEHDERARRRVRAEPPPRPRMCSPIAIGAAGRAHRGDVVDSRPAVGGRRPLVGHGAVERGRNIGQSDRGQAEGFDDVLDVLDFGRRQMLARQDVDAPRNRAVPWRRERARG